MRVVRHASGGALREALWHGPRWRFASTFLTFRKALYLRPSDLIISRDRFRTLQLNHSAAPHTTCRVRIVRNVNKDIVDQKWWAEGGPTSCHPHFFALATATGWSGEPVQQRSELGSYAYVTASW